MKEPALAVEWWAIEDVRPYERNARRMTDAAVPKLAASIAAFGWRQPIVVDDDGVIIAGHTRLAAAKSLGLERVPVHVAAGLSPEKVRAYRLADNRIADETSWDYAELNRELEELAQAAVLDMRLTGFDPGELAGLPIEEDEDPTGRSDGSLLALADVSVDEPDHEVVHGDTWHVGEHILICAEVATEHDQWAPYLEPGVIFAPYPGPLLALTVLPPGERLLLVQPDPYIAGHILDHYATILGEEGVRRG